MTFLVSGTKAAGRWMAATVRERASVVGNLQQVVSEGDAGHVVEGFVVDGHAGQGARADHLQKLLKGDGTGNGEHGGARGHDFADDFVAEFDGGADQLAITFLDDAFFLAGLDEGLDGFGRGGIAMDAGGGFGQRGDGQQELHEQGDGKDEPQQQQQEPAPADDPRAAGAGEEDVREEAIEQDDDEDDAEDDLGDLLPASAVADAGALEKEHAEDQRQAGQGEIHEDGRGELDAVALHAKARFDALLPEVDVFLELAGQELAHLGIEAIDVGREGEHDQQQGDGDGRDDAHGLRLLCAFFRAGFVLRSMRPVARPKRRRRAASSRAMRPVSVS